MPRRAPGLAGHCHPSGCLHPRPRPLGPREESTMNDKIPRALDGFYLLCIWISGLAIAAMSLIIPWGVYARYVLGTGSSWPEPVAVLCMVTFTFFGAAAGYRAGAHIAVGMLTDRLPT